MKEFKTKLKEELRQDAPFTNDIKQRILQPKPIKRKSNWQVVSVSIAACFIIGLMLFVEFSQKNNLQTASQQNELLPIVDDISSLDIIEPKYADLLGEQWMLRFLPMIIDKEAKITYGDYIAFYGTDGLVVSTVLGLGNDKITMNQGQILVDNTALKVHGLNEQIKKEDINDPFKNPYFFHHFGTRPAPFIDKSISAKEKEIVVYDSNEGHTIMKINEEQLVGKVVGFQNFELTFELTEQEQQVIDAFKTDYNVEKLKNMTPQAITKIFLLSDIEKDFETYEALFTTNINKETESVRRYYEETKTVRQKLFTEEINRLIIANLFAGLENAEFEQQTDTVGVVKFISIEGTQTELSMEKNAQGIWQPAFSRGIY
ncbi:hypothetical protein [Lysinibacillus fusiformis]|uniref:hypothetical protein n=2 Tax=Lysinibacillus fusiformis TaxID=28031 RepID=UPI003AACD641